MNKMKAFTTISMLLVAALMLGCAAPASAAPKPEAMASSPQTYFIVDPLSGQAVGSMVLTPDPTDASKGDWVYIGVDGTTDSGHYFYDLTITDLVIKKGPTSEATFRQENGICVEKERRGAWKTGSPPWPLSLGALMVGPVTATTSMLCAVPESTATGAVAAIPHDQPIVITDPTTGAFLGTLVLNDYHLEAGTFTYVALDGTIVEGYWKKLYGSAGFLSLKNLGATGEVVLDYEHPGTVVERSRSGVYATNPIWGPVPLGVLGIMVTV